MSLFQTNDLITISLYYKLKQVNNREKLFILDDKKGEKLLKEGDTEIKQLETKWRSLTWEDHNIVMEASYSKLNSQGERVFSMSKYRESMVEKCLKEWNITENEVAVPLNSKNIGKLPAAIVLNLYRKFEQISEYSEEELGN